ncbi:hypothetical protein AcV5_009140 [Taiwanofungus camphoratus]|nr:hypothetical protein AcV5_009140 [Antrodia cinnamomea]
MVTNCGKVLTKFGTVSGIRDLAFQRASGLFNCHVFQIRRSSSISVYNGFYNIHLTERLVHWSNSRGL